MPDDTRERIIDGACRALARNGYERTSVKDIAHEAGVAAGLVHYYFKSKEDLVLDAIKRWCEGARIRRPDLSPTDEAQGAFESVKQTLRQRREFYTLLFDMVGLAMHNDRVAQAVQSFIRDDRGEIESLTRAVIAVSVPERMEAAPAIAAVIWAGLAGIAMQDLLDSSFDADAAIDALAEMALTMARVGA